jgi:hypothetical protein
LAAWAVSPSEWWSFALVRSLEISSRSFVEALAVHPLGGPEWHPLADQGARRPARSVLQRAAIRIPARLTRSGPGATVATSDNGSYVPFGPPGISPDPTSSSMARRFRKIVENSVSHRQLVRTEAISWVACSRYSVSMERSSSNLMLTEYRELATPDRETSPNSRTIWRALGEIFVTCPGSVR